MIFHDIFVIFHEFFIKCSRWVEEIRKVGKQLTDLDDVLEQLESAYVYV